MIPSYGEINYIDHRLSPICIRVPRGPCIGADTAIVICELRLVFDNAGVEFDNIGILY